MSANKKHSFDQWDVVGVVFEGDEIAIGGLNPWEHKWQALGYEAVELAHPSYPRQRHRMFVYEIEHEETKVTFAAGELSANVWGFYVPRE